MAECWWLWWLGTSDKCGVTPTSPPHDTLSPVSPAYFPTTTIATPTSQAPTATAAVIKCQVRQGSNTLSSLCDGDVQYADSGLQEHITVWSPATMMTGHHRRQLLHRKLVRLA